MEVLYIVYGLFFLVNWLFLLMISLKSSINANQYLEMYTENRFI
jgi:hypothetical protein